MKKILLIMALLPCLTFGATRTWTSAASTDMNLSANYDGSGALLTTDDLVFNNTSVVNAAATAPLSVNSVTIASNYTGTWSLSGQTLTCAAGFSDDGITGAHNYGDGITCNGASSTFHVGSGVGTVTATSCAVTMNTVTAGILDVDKGVNFKSLVLGASATVATTGTTTSFSNSTTVLTLGANAALSLGANMALTLTGACDAYSLGAGYSITGAGTLSIFTNVAGAINLPAMTKANAFYIRSTVSGSVVTLTGAISCGVLRILTVVSTLTFNQGENAITCSDLNFGISGAGTGTFNFTNAINLATFDCSSYNSGTVNGNFDNSVITCTGSWTYGSNHIINPGTSTVTFNGTGAQTITSNGKIFYDITANNTGTSFITRADSLTCHDLTLTDGPWNSATYGIRADDFIYSTTDSCRFQNLWLTGDFTRSAGATKNDTAAQHIRFLAGTSHTMAAAGKTYAQITMSGPTTITGGAVINKLSYGIDGIKSTFEAAKKVTAGSLPGFGGASGSLDSALSATPGAMDTLSCPQDTPAYVYTRDQYMVNPRYLPATSVSGGNNRNVKTLSYTGVTKDISTGTIGATVTFTGSGFAGACWLKFNSDSSALTVVSYTSATKAVPSLAPGVYAVSVGNSDGDQASVGNFTVTAAGGSIRNKKYRFSADDFRF
jgi:hypothetical protein